MGINCGDQNRTNKGGELESEIIRSKRDRMQLVDCQPVGHSHAELELKPEKSGKINCEWRLKTQQQQILI